MTVSELFGLGKKEEQKKEEVKTEKKSKKDIKWDDDDFEDED